MLHHKSMRSLDVPFTHEKCISSKLNTIFFLYKQDDGDSDCYFGISNWIIPMHGIWFFYGWYWLNTIKPTFLHIFTGLHPTLALSWYSRRGWPYSKATCESSALKKFFWHQIEIADYSGSQYVNDRHSKCNELYFILIQEARKMKDNRYMS